MAFPFAAKIAAQPGPQTAFLRSGADICIYGGAAGGGKTAALILEPLRHVGRVANFTAVFFRRTMPQITNPGALWDESLSVYPRLGGTPHVRLREWRWRHGGKIKFSHLQFETTVYDWQGAQITLICFDELTHFSAHQFFYMVSRNRSTCGVRPYGAGIFRSDHSQIRRHPARPSGARSRAARRHARRVVVARFDRGEPAALSTGDDADETGIIVAGKDHNGHGYVLADLSGRYPPTEWARLAITAYRTHRADRIVAEVNNGGDMVGATLRMVDPNVAFTAVRASRGKVVRAEPVAALYQQGRVHHIGTFRNSKTR